METSASFEARYAPSSYPTDLDRRPAFGRCPKPGVEMDGSRGRKLDRSSPWLRPRGVRSDDAAHRPREKRQSCPLKAVGCGGDLDNPCVVTDASGFRDNSENNKTKRDAGASH
jgi:hypothetical protein